MRITLVSYLNTLPFVWGLQQWKSAQLLKAPPAQCVEHYEQEKAAIALVPVAGLLTMQRPWKRLKNFCIASYQKVETVLLLSNAPLEELTKIYLDPDSRTSNLLIQILFNHFLKKEVTFIPGVKQVFYREREAGYVRIGDKALWERPLFSYAYDLATLWYQYSRLPMVFAVWIADPKVPKKILQQLHHYLSMGVNAIEQQVPQWASAYEVDPAFLKTYLTQAIHYHFNETTEQALQLFLSLSKQCATFYFS